jgi:hypothetical protein
VVKTNPPTGYQYAAGLGERADKIGKMVNAEGEHAVEADICIWQSFRVAFGELQVGVSAWVVAKHGRREIEASS